MRDAVICEPLRTPGGPLRRSVPRRAGGRPGRRRDPPSWWRAPAWRPRTSTTCSSASATPTARPRASAAWPPSTPICPSRSPGYQLDRRCGSGLQTIINAAMQVQTGASEIVLAGGVESMSQSEFYTTAMRWGAGAENVVMYDRLARGRVTSGGVNYPVPGGMLETAENLRREYQIPRQEQDEFSLRSHQRAVAAQEKGGLRRRDRPDHGPRAQGRHGRQRRRAPAPGHHARVPGQAAPGDAPPGCRRHGHRRQFERPERRRLGLPRHLPREGRRARAPSPGPPAVVGRGRRGAGADGHRARSRPRPRRSSGPACHWPTSP